ncbi:MAG: hypothetical protein KME30_25685 [Iphinoe sp. HA4291-MV1]|jgi:hypothetical protein|nr:hypothetical protein [Iphinoe sp. HA4291-MV1]
MAMGVMNTIYSDELITATELNRQPGRVLDKALEHPVTITRNDQSFALLPRENVALFVKAAQRSREIVELLNTAFRLLLKQKIGTEHPYGWLEVFDSDELNEFIDEIMSAYRSVDLSEKAWDELDAIIHEWHESALAISNPELEAAFSLHSDELEEIALSQPIGENVA